MAIEKNGDYEHGDAIRFPPDAVSWVLGNVKTGQHHDAKFK